MNDARRALPSVSALLESDAVRPLLVSAPRPLVTEAARRAVAAARQEPANAPATADAWADAIQATLDALRRPSLRSVINGTGVVLHTSLGRAPLADVAIDAIARTAAGFTNLEYDIDRGARGSRYDHCAALLRELTGAEDALVVNNGAAALVLALNTLADGREAIVSRGELVEIGGSFRIPDIMAKSGARLVETGTTNRTHVEDYRRALSNTSAAIVKVHRSNFALEGFVADVEPRALAELASEHGISLVHDLGSGLMLSLDAFGLRGEPTAREAVAAGATLVVMSGDKLLGGPQAGLLLGNAETIDRVRSNPLTRSYRVDKLTLAALEATLDLYRDPPRALREIPALAMLTTSVDTLRARAEKICETVGARLTAIATTASVGGGAFPTARISSFGIAIREGAVAMECALRLGAPSVVGRIADGQLLVDLRTVFPREDLILSERLRAVVA